MDQAFDVVCLGEATMDIFLTLNERSDIQNFSFQSGEKYLAEGYKMSPGGIASNISVGLSRLGRKVAIIAETGDDELSDNILNRLSKEGVSLNFIKRNTGTSITLSAIVRHKGQHIIFSAHVLKEHEFKFEDVNTSWMLLAGLGEKWKEPYEKALDLARQKKVKIAFAPGSTQLSEGKEALVDFISSANLLFLNKDEAQNLMGESDDIKSLLNEFRKMGAKIVVITDGLNGSYCMDEDSNAYHAGIVSVSTIETTGAGDAYTSGFLAAFTSGESVENSMKWGAINSSSVVQKIGAQEGLLDSGSLNAKLSEARLSVKNL